MMSLWGTMASSTSSKQLVLQLVKRNISYFTRRSCALHRSSSSVQQSQQQNVNNRCVSSFASVAAAAAAAIEIKEPVKHTTTYAELIRNRNKPSEPDNKKSAQEEEESPFTYGHIRWFDIEKGYAIIREEVSNDAIYLNFSDIDVSETARMNPKLIKPQITRGLRVRFQVRTTPKNGEGEGNNKTAYDVQRWNGNKIALLHYKDALSIARRARAWLGHRCYETLNEEQNAAAMSEQIRMAYKESNTSIEWVRSQLIDSNFIIRECKAELGNEVFDILENIFQIDDVQRKVDEAFVRCERTLDELELLGIRQEEKEPPR